MSAVETARSGLARMIASGELAAGELLPSEAELCTRFGVSRSSLREAQKMLSVAGVLTSNRGRRSAVSSMDPDQIMSGLNMVIPLLPLDRYVEMFPLREVLEGHVAAQAAAKMSDEECQALLELAEELASTQPSDRAQTLDADFHRMIIKGAGDEMIAALLDAMRRRGRDYRMFEMQKGVQLKGVSDEAHREIALAITHRDPESARYLSMQHVRVTREWMKNLRPGPIVFESGPDEAASSD